MISLNTTVYKSITYKRTLHKPLSWKVKLGISK